MWLHRVTRRSPTPTSYPRCSRARPRCGIIVSVKGHSRSQSLKEFLDLLLDLGEFGVDLSHGAGWDVLVEVGVKGIS